MEVCCPIDIAIGEPLVWDRSFSQRIGRIARVSYTIGRGSGPRHWAFAGNVLFFRVLASVGVPWAISLNSKTEHEREI